MNENKFIACIIDIDYYDRKDPIVYGIYPTEELAFKSLLKIIFTEKVTFFNFNNIREIELEENIDNIDPIFNENINDEEEFINKMILRINDEKSLIELCQKLRHSYGDKNIKWGSWYVFIGKIGESLLC
jgi:hypothetical protein